MIVKLFSFVISVITFHRKYIHVYKKLCIYRKCIYITTMMTSGGVQESITTTTHLRSFRAELFAKTCRFMPWNFFHSLDVIYELIILPRVYIYTHVRVHTVRLSLELQSKRTNTNSETYVEAFRGLMFIYRKARQFFSNQYLTKSPPVRVDVKRYSKNFNRPCARRKIIISRKNGFKTQAQMYKKIWRNKW